MGKQTAIAWTDHTWNPWHGCRKVSQGCRSCYMYREKARYGQDPTKVVRSQDATFYAPLKWEREAAGAGVQRRVFTCSWSDFFIEEADAWRDDAFAVMALTPHLTYQVLTKRPERMLAYLNDPLLHNRVELAAEAHNLGLPHPSMGRKRMLRPFPLPTVWLGVSVEDQATADARIPLLLQTPAAKRFVSYEPALDAIDFSPYLPLGPGHDPRGDHWCQQCARWKGQLDWIIVGGESGPEARPFDLAWAYTTIEQCRAAGVACFTKQLGAFPVQFHEVGTAKGGSHRPLNLANRAGADPSEWPEALRVQEWADTTQQETTP